MCRFPRAYYLDDEVSHEEFDIFKLKNDDVQDPEPLHISELFGFGIKSICQNDRVLFDATKKPNNFICRLLIKDKQSNYYVATGFFISPRCVITSGHCVFFNGNWVKSIKVIPGASGLGNKEPFGFQTSVKFKSVKGWTQYNDRNFDYGAIILPDNMLYNRVKGFFDVKVLGAEKVVFNYGYTDESDKRHEQWGDSGNIHKTTSHRIYYFNDTEKGNSGSPIIVKNQSKYQVVGIHSFGKCPNFAIKINKVILRKWEKWREY